MKKQYQIKEGIRGIDLIQHLATTNTINGNLLEDIRRILVKCIESLKQKDNEIKVLKGKIDYLQNPS